MKVRLLMKKKKLIIIFDEMSGINSLESDHPSGAEFIILDADPRRIKRIRVIMPKVE